jgi:hypothetical protein
MVFTVDNIPDGIAYPADNLLFRDFIINDYLNDKPFLKARIDAVIAQRGGATTNPSQDIVSWVYEGETFYGFQKIENNDGAIQEAKDNLATLVAGYEAELAAQAQSESKEVTGEIQTGEPGTPADTETAPQVEATAKEPLNEQDYSALASLFQGLNLPEIDISDPSLQKVGERLYQKGDLIFFNYEMSFISPYNLKTTLAGILGGRGDDYEPRPTENSAIIISLSTDETTLEEINEKIKNINLKQKAKIDGVISELNAKYEKFINLNNYRFSVDGDNRAYELSELENKTPNKIYYDFEGKGEYREVGYSYLPSYVKKEIVLTNTEELDRRETEQRNNAPYWVIGQDGKARPRPLTEQDLNKFLWKPSDGKKCIKITQLFTSGILNDEEKQKILDNLIQYSKFTVDINGVFKNEKGEVIKSDSIVYEEGFLEKLIAVVNEVRLGGVNTQNCEVIPIIGRGEPTPPTAPPAPAQPEEATEAIKTGEPGTPVADTEPNAPLAQPADTYKETLTEQGLEDEGFITKNPLNLFGKKQLHIKELLDYPGFLTQNEKEAIKEAMVKEGFVVNEDNSYSTEKKPKVKHHNITWNDYISSLILETVNEARRGGVNAQPGGAPILAGAGNLPPPPPGAGATTPAPNPAPNPPTPPQGAGDQPPPSFQELADAFVNNPDQAKYQAVKEAGEVMQTLFEVEVNGKTYKLFMENPANILQGLDVNGINASLLRSSDEDLNYLVQARRFAFAEKGKAGFTYSASCQQGGIVFSNTDATGNFAGAASDFNGTQSFYEGGNLKTDNTIQKDEAIVAILKAHRDKMRQGFKEEAPVLGTNPLPNSSINDTIERRLFGATVGESRAG